MLYSPRICVLVAAMGIGCTGAGNASPIAPAEVRQTDPTDDPAVAETGAETGEPEVGGQDSSADGTLPTREDVAVVEDGLAALSDEFDGAAVADGWDVYNGGLIDMRVEDGALIVEPNQYSVWFHADAGPALFRTVEGDFKLTTSVRARRASDPSVSVDSAFQFAGIMMRDPASDTAGGQENYVFSVVGYRGDYFAAETKSTVNDLSMVDGPPWPNTDAELRICRVGDSFRLFIREIGASEWNAAIRYDRPDIPSTVQAGPIAYVYTDDYDLQASFDYVRYAPVQSAADCTTDE